MAITVNQPRAADRQRFQSIAVASDRSKAFAAAIRHSARVRVLRILLPMLALGTCALYIAPSKWTFEVAGNQVAIDTVSVSTGDLKMTNPRIKGQNKKQGQYDVRASSATQTVADPDTLNLNEIEADVINASGETTKLRAPGGIYKSKLEEMVFNKGVVIERSSGLIANLKSASAFFQKDLVVSKEAVEVLLKESVIRANALDLFTDQSRAVFTGEVFVHMVREASPADAASTPPAPTAEAASYQLDPQKPIDVTSNSLEVDDLKKLAIFRENVTAVQGEFNIRSNELQIAYAASGAAATPSPTPNVADVKYIEARGAVVVTSKENQTARAEKAVYDAARQTMTLTESVTVAQEKNIIQSDSVIFDVASGKSLFQMISDKRLKAVFTPKGASDAPPQVKVAPKPDTATPQGVMPAALITSADAKKPINIEARSLEVDDKKQLATFRDNVSATQGDFNIRARELEVGYANARGGAKPPANAAQPAGDVRTIIAKGKVLVTSKEQNASSDKAVFDVKSQTVTLTENVIVTQGKNIIKGDRLVIDVATGKSTFQMNDNGRTSAVFEAKGDIGEARGEPREKPKPKPDTAREPQ